MDNHEQLELLQSMSERLERIEKRQRAARGWRLVIWLCVIAMLCAVVIYFGPGVVERVQKYNAAMERASQLSEQLGELDLSGLKNTVDYLKNVDYDALKEKTAEASELLSKLSKLDIDKLGATEDLAKLMETLDKLDINKLSTTIEEFNDSIALLLKLSE